jgi:hypothetical protein
MKVKFQTETPPKVCFSLHYLLFLINMKHLFLVLLLVVFSASGLFAQNKAIADSSVHNKITHRGIYGDTLYVSAPLSGDMPDSIYIPEYKKYLKIKIITTDNITILPLVGFEHRFTDLMTTPESTK